MSRNKRPHCARLAKSDIAQDFYSTLEKVKQFCSTFFKSSNLEALGSSPRSGVYLQK